MRSPLITLLAALPLLAACQSGNDAFFPANKSKNVNPDTHLTITFDATPTLGESGFIRVYDAATDALVDELDMSIPAAPSRRRYGPECDYLQTPYDYTRTVMPTNRDTRPGTPSAGAAPETEQRQLTIIGGFTDGFHFHPIIVHDNVATIYLHNNMLEYGHKYYVTIDPDVLVCGDFPGVKKGEWKFSTKKSGPKDPLNLTVNCNGSGDFNTLQGALDFVPDWSKETITIDVAEGDYEEIVYCRNKSNLLIKGAGMDKTRIHYENDEGFNPHPLNLKTNEKRGTFPSRRGAVAFDNCADIVLQDLTCETAPKGQAEGLLINGERVALYRVHIIGGGDALQANGTVYLENCELDGGLDSILGRGSLFAYRSKFRNSGGPVTWVRNFAPDHGDIFVECHFEGTGNRPIDFGRTHLNAGTDYTDAELVAINCTVRNFNPKGWSQIGCETAVQLEFNTRDADTGKEVDYSQRDPWSRRLDAVKDAELIRNYSTPAFVLKGWTPESQIK